MPESSEYTRLGDGGTGSLLSRWNYLTRLEKALILISTVFGIVIFSLAIALAACNAQVHPTPSPNVTTIAPTSPPTGAPNTTTIVPPSTTTPEPKTTTVAPDTTTVAPDTTTVAPDTTTVAPDTTTVAPDTTTVAPDTTTVAPDTTTVAPVTTTVPPVTTTKKHIPIETESSTSENIKLKEREFVTSEDEQNINSEQPTKETVTEFSITEKPIPLTRNKFENNDQDELMPIKNIIDKQETQKIEVTTGIPLNKISEEIVQDENSSQRPVLSR